MTHQSIELVLAQIQGVQIEPCLDCLQRVKTKTCVFEECGSPLIRCLMPDLSPADAETHFDTANSTLPSVDGKIRLFPNFFRVYGVMSVRTAQQMYVYQSTSCEGKLGCESYHSSSSSLER